MSTGIVVCSQCKREIHQGFDMGWFHCEGQTARCQGASSIYPASTHEIIGKWCGIDGDGSIPGEPRRKIVPKGDDGLNRHERRKLAAQMRRQRAGAAR